MVINIEKCLVCDIVSKIYGIYSIILILVSTIGNLYSSIISFRLANKNKEIFRILAFMFILEALTLYTWTLDIFLAIFSPEESINNIDNVNIIESLTIPTCKIFTFNQYFTLEAISWLLVFLLVHQNIQLYFPRLKYNVKLVCLLILAFFILFNSHILIFAGKIDNTNVTLFWNATFQTSELKPKVNCFHGVTFDFYQFWPLWDKIHLCVYSFIPFLLMVICNIITIKKIQMPESVPTTEARTEKHRKFIKKKKLSIILLILSFCFILCSLPQIILYGYFFDLLLKDKRTFLLLPGSDLLNFTFVGLNFLIFLFANKIFRNECRLCWHLFRRWLRFQFFKCLFMCALLSETKYSFECDKYFNHRSDHFKHNNNNIANNLDKNSLIIIN